MAEIVSMPKLGFDMAEGLLVRWAVEEGKSVEKGQLLAEIETDKATVEVESPFGGTVLKHLVAQNTLVPVNLPIAVIGAVGESVDLSGFASALPTAPTAGAGGAAPPPEKAAATESAQAPAGRPIATTSPASGSQSPTDGNRLPDGVRASPLARNVARQHGVPLAGVPGSGPKGRVIRRDVEAFLESPEPLSARPASAVSSSRSPLAEDRRVPLSKLRQTIGRRMTEAKQGLPHFYVTYDYDLDELMGIREQSNAMLAESKIKLSVNDFVIKAAALTLREFPNLNASLGTGEVIQFSQINIGIAVAVPNGLLTVVCRDADYMSISQISANVKAMAGRAREGKVHPEDISGSTFTTSNLGMYGVDEFAAIINPPEAAILALGAARQTAVVKAGAVLPGWRMKATISVDHRVSDGAEAAEFMQAMARYLESPLRMMV